MILEWLATLTLLLACIIGLGLCIIGFGGTFIILLGAILYNLFHFSLVISLNTLALLLILAVVGELLEWFTPVIHGKASNHAYIGMILGAIIGASMMSFIFLIGSIAGLFIGGIVGAYLGELIHTHNADKAWQAAKVALKNRIVISATKTILALIQLAAIFFAI